MNRGGRIWQGKEVGLKIGRSECLKDVESQVGGRTDVCPRMRTMMMISPIRKLVKHHPS